MQCKWPSKRCCLNARLPLWALCWASFCKSCSSQSPQCEEKTHFEPSSPSPPSVHAIDAESSNFSHFVSTTSFLEAEGSQITEIQETCCTTRPWKRKKVTFSFRTKNRSDAPSQRWGGRARTVQQQHLRKRRTTINHREEQWAQRAHWRWLE